MRRWLALIAALAAAALASVVVASAVTTEEFVGEGRCQDCHRSAHQVWKASAHARAHEALSGAQSADPRCTQCHGVAVRGVAGVQCESCHGAGHYYAKRYVMRDEVLCRIVGLDEVGEKTCKRCHTENNPSIRAFDYPAMWRIVQHGREPKEKPAQAAGP
ncbi:MAG: hypothetical protein JXR96_22930 [Deltaproteobacteria bacterium]|nr:hypothetical protein [Deltaproteobacteria bacterium]